MTTTVTQNIRWFYRASRPSQMHFALVHSTDQDGTHRITLSNSRSGIPLSEINSGDVQTAREEWARICQDMALKGYVKMTPKD